MLNRAGERNSLEAVDHAGIPGHLLERASSEPGWFFCALLNPDQSKAEPKVIAFCLTANFAAWNLDLGVDKRESWKGEG